MQFSHRRFLSFASGVHSPSPPAFLPQWRQGQTLAFVPFPAVGSPTQGGGDRKRSLLLALGNNNWVHRNAPVRLFVWIVLIAFFVGLPTKALAADVRMSWIADTDKDLAGYKVYYGTASRNYSTSIKAGNVTSYTLTGLSAGTYYFAVTAYDTSGNESGLSPEASLTIASSTLDTTPPVLSGVGSSSITSSGATINWTTNETSDSQVEYGTTTSYGSSTALASSLVTSHSVVLSGLQASKLYHYRVKSRDAAGNLATSGDFTFTTAADTTAPVISGVGASSITSSGGTIKWTTNEASDSQVEYGTTTSYGSSTTLASSLVTGHSVVLSGLQASKLYHYRVKSRDAAGNLATSGDFSFTTITSGSLSGNLTTTSGAISLTTQGTTDWAHWGLTTTSSFDHKNGVPQQISNFVKLGAATVNRLTDNPTSFSWSDGTPTTSITSTRTGIFVVGLNQGFQITVPADTTSRTLKLCVGLWRAQAKLEVTLGDGSAPAYLNTSLSNKNGTTNGLYTLNFRAASTGRTLTIKYTLLTNYHPKGNITLEAATLSGTVQALTIIDPSAAPNLLISQTKANASGKSVSKLIFIPSIVEGRRLRTNLGINNLSSNIANVNISLVNRHGAVVARKRYQVDPMGLKQINHVTRVLHPDRLEDPIRGSLYLESDEPILAWVAQIDNRSNEPNLLLGHSTGSNRILIPKAANLDLLRSSLDLMNLGASIAQVSIKAFDIDGSVVGQTQAPLFLSSGRTLSFVDLLKALGVRENLGSIEITSVNEAPLLATSWVLNTDHPGNTFEGLSASDASRFQIIPSVVNDVEVRTNLGINNVNDSPASVTVRLRTQEGSELGILEATVPSKGLTQLTDVVRTLVHAQDVSNLMGYIELESDEPILAWASQIDARTHDSGFVAGQGEGSNRLLIPSVTNAGGFRSGLVVVNTGNSDAVVDILSRGPDGTIQNELKDIFVPTKGYFSSTNILETLGSSQSAGSLEIISTNGQPIVVSSRVYSISGASAFFAGQRIE